MSLQFKSSFFTAIFFILLNNLINLHSAVQCELNNDAVDKEQILIDKLLKNYNKKLRPSGTVQVKFALNLNQIIKLIEKDQIFMLNVFDLFYFDLIFLISVYFINFFTFY